MKLEPTTLKRMVRNVLTTRPDEIGCDECFEELDLFVEMKLSGKNAAGRTAGPRLKHCY